MVMSPAPMTEIFGFRLTASTWMSPLPIDVS